ncbi:MAG: hypothetical protein QHG99_04605 [Methanomicrobiales archaeon]|nr:hypothetical protein [Methanomicrobiales archaeon]
MEPKRRRSLISLVIIGLGLLLIFFDFPTEVVLAGSFVSGVAIIIGAGVISSRNAKKGMKEGKGASKRKAAIEPEREKAPAESNYSGVGGVLRILYGLPKRILHHLRIHRARDQEEKKIDRILDELIEQNPVKSADKAPASGKVSLDPAPVDKGADPFAALADAKVDEEFLTSLEPEKGGDALVPVDPSKFDLSKDERGEGVKLDQETDEVEEILKSYGMEIGTEESDHTGDALAELKDLDIGEIDLDAIIPESGDGAIAEAPVPKNPPQVQAPVTATPATREPVKEEQVPPSPPQSGDAFDIALPGSGESEFISLLKSDAKKITLERDLSLLRDLKDQRCRAEDLIDEMEELLARSPTGVEIRSPDKKVAG